MLCKLQEQGEGWINPETTPCRHPDHDISSMIVLEPGTYEHTCPRCKIKKIFNVPPRPVMWTMDIM